MTNIKNNLMEIKNDRMLMNKETGSVDTEENWLAESYEWDLWSEEERKAQFSSLIEVQLVVDPKNILLAMWQQVE